MTNEAGYYSITMPRGQYQIEYRMMGMKTTRRNVIVYSDGVLDVGMDEDLDLMEAVIVTATRDNIKDVRTGTELINVKMLRQIPMGLGEADIIKARFCCPGFRQWAKHQQALMCGEEAQTRTWCCSIMHL
ncbi:MAG: carboxypeptidase-like regulatory domain-containing protein [Marinilabiliales bacterium]|nr:carboxypeptidase-like regulatory domain-containing protein [Marinilabiliales bacterium]